MLFVGGLTSLMSLNAEYIDGPCVLVLGTGGWNLRLMARRQGTELTATLEALSGADLSLFREPGSGFSNSNLGSSLN